MLAAAEREVRSAGVHGLDPRHDTKLHVRKLLAELPVEPATHGDKVHYDAGRRVTVLHPTTRHRGRLHEADADGMPICIMRGFFEEQAPEDIEELGGGPVTCGHCANARNA